ncbi:TonB family protein [Hyphomicrobium sp. LHD-15]|uniref:cell envelope integrity protein TolA n=1 Tax=Hyphomicrobium sp. LHD-15 TaxID=3072142 RepID=UPI00280E37E9|nr:TonB family protein [Hyphomicrobium sp. LHD-15]MDQ8699574.1 TonB family protein [Hyphomicrobium sp. LHD-15]
MTITPTDHRFANRALVSAASAAMSILLHGSVLAAALLLVERRPGAISAPTEAISLEFLQSEVIEAVATSPALSVAASQSSVQSEAGAAEDISESAAPKALEPVPIEQQLASKEPIQPKSKVEVPKGLDVVQGGHEETEQAGAEEPSQRREKTQPDTNRRQQQRPVKTAKVTNAAANDKTDTKPVKKGAAQSSAAKASAGSTARVSASTGSAVNYAALVRGRVAARKPAGGGRRGTVVVFFGLSRSGALVSASVSRSSGNTSLDASVLSAVRGAGPFPTPPPGANLSFRMPFHFK